MGARVAAQKVMLKRAYDRPVTKDGTRVLIDRLWPRGVKKVDAATDRLVKGIARARSCESGSDMTRLVGMNSAGAYGGD